MHKAHNVRKVQNGPETTGAVIHWSFRHELLVRLMGLGVDSSNSRMIVGMARIKPGNKVLDVGCGTGDLTLTVKHYVGMSGSVCGIDASPDGIDLARKKAVHSDSDAVFEVGLIEKIPFAEASFDVVISRLVIHHLSNGLKCQGIAEIFRVLKPGGRIFLVDFKPPANPIFVHVATALVGHRTMMQSDMQSLCPMLTKTGFIDITFGPTRSALLAFVSGKKPEIHHLAMGFAQLQIEELEFL